MRHGKTLGKPLMRGRGREEMGQEGSWAGGEGVAEGAMAGWHRRLDGHGFEQALRAGDGQGGLVCCSPWGRRESDMTERLNLCDMFLEMALCLLVKHILKDPVRTTKKT